MESIDAFFLENFNFTNLPIYQFYSIDTIGYTNN